MIKNPITIPLKSGKKPSTQFDTFVIEPANLFNQSKTNKQILFADPTRIEYS